MIFRVLSVAAQGLYQRTTFGVGRSSIAWLPFQQPQLQLVGMPSAAAAATAPSTSSIWEDLATWFAVPKQKVSRHKKRLKTTVQNRIKLRSNITVDARTGETTLRHKMPSNWKDYLPKMADE